MASDNNDTVLEHPYEDMEPLEDLQLDVNLSGIEITLALL